MTKLNEETRLCIQDVVELSQFVSSRGEWPQIRLVIEQGGHDPDRDFLVSFMEGEEGEEFGTIVGVDDRVFAWFRNTDQVASPAAWREITNLADEMTDDPAIRVAIDHRQEILQALIESGYR